MRGQSHPQNSSRRSGARDRPQMGASASCLVETAGSSATWRRVLVWRHIRVAQTLNFPWLLPDAASPHKGEFGILSFDNSMHPTGRASMNSAGVSSVALSGKRWAQDSRYPPQPRTIPAGRQDGRSRAFSMQPLRRAQREWQDIRVPATLVFIPAGNNTRYTNEIVLHDIGISGLIASYWSLADIFRGHSEQN